MPLLRTTVTALWIFLAGSSVLAQTPIDPATASKQNPNPATSTTTDDEGNNPLAREGDHSATGHGRSPPPEAGQQPGTVGRSSSEGGGTGVPDPLYVPQKR